MRIIDRFDAIAQLNSKRAALHGDTVYSYAELRDKALRFASFLKALKCDVHEPRAVLNFPKSPEYIIAVLGCLYAGFSFTPIEPSLPQARLDFILEDIQPHIIISMADMDEILSVEPLEKAADYSLSHLAYILYTSGSTGQPKGVMVEYKGLYNVISQQIKCFDVDEFSHVFLLLSISFDASLSDIFCALLSGACLHIEEGEKQLIAADLPAILHKRQITHIDIPPSMLRILNPDDMPRSLRSLIIGGEVCPLDTVKKWAGKYLLNSVYGPTEASICTSMIRCDADKWDRPLIGRPMDNVEYVIDEGELLIGGIQLARGYWQREDLNQAKFIDYKGAAFYRTGDHVRQDADGEYVFLGRVDRQVKVRGQLVELEEVEQHLLSLSTIQRGIVSAFTDNKGKKQLAAFYQGQGDIDVDVIKAHIGKALPEYMVPQYYRQVSHFTLTPSGKIDAQALPFDFEAPEDNITQPVTPRQKLLWSIWSEILERDDFGVAQSFFDLGGDSIDAIDFTLRAAKAGYSISPSMLSKHFTILQLDKMLEALSPQDAGMSVQELSAHIKIPKIPASQPNNGEALFMTGATGFLGARLLHDLLAASDKAFICLVRAGSEEEGLERILQAMAKQGLQVSNEAQSRIEVICGDITLENFGLSDAAWQGLCVKTKSIIHCAAVVNMVKSFEELRAANFDACTTIMRLALEGGIPHIDYISTLSVFVSTDQNEGRVLESDMLRNIGRVYGGYAQTKVAAELAFHHSEFTKYVPVSSYRLGLITGDTFGGRSAPHDFLSTFFNGIKQLGRYPQGDFSHLKVDVTPVDFASACLTQLLLQDEKQECYHIANVEGFSLPQMVNVMQGRGINLRAVPIEDWQALPQVRDLKADEQAAWLGLCRALASDDFSRYRSMDLFQATNIDFDMARLKAALPKIEYPKADDALLNLYMQESGL